MEEKEKKVEEKILGAEAGDVKNGRRRQRVEESGKQARLHQWMTKWQNGC